MEEKDDILFEKIKEILSNFKGNFSILEHQVDVRLQMEYFDFSKNVKREENPQHILSQEQELYNPELSLESKKELLVQFASIEQPEAYRVIERFLKNCPSDLKDWTILAFQENRILLESKLLEENQVYISTGLGGQSDKLRYFIAVFSEADSNFTDVQRKLISSEFDFQFIRFNAEIEKMEFQSTFVTMIALIPLDIPVKDPVKSSIDECNSLGRFIKEGFLITNVKIFSAQEVENILNNNLPEELKE